MNILAIVALIAVTVLVNVLVTKHLINSALHPVNADIDFIGEALFSVDERLVEVLPAYVVTESKTPSIPKQFEKPQTDDWMMPLWDSDEDRAKDYVYKLNRDASSIKPEPYDETFDESYGMSQTY